VEGCGNRKFDVVSLGKKLKLHLLVYTSRKPVRCTRKLLKIRSKLILIPFTSFVEYVLFFYFVVRNVVGKIDKETLRIRFRIDPTFWLKKITKTLYLP
jgi:hypothetical protein